MKLDHSLTPYPEINSKWMKDLEVRQESIKILEDNIGDNLYDIGQSNLFHDTSPKARETKDTINIWDFIRITCFCTAKETVKKTKTQPTERENILEPLIYSKKIHLGRGGQRQVVSQDYEWIPWAVS